MVNQPIFKTSSGRPKDDGILLGCAMSPTSLLICKIVQFSNRRIRDTKSSPGVQNVKTRRHCVFGATELRVLKNHDSKKSLF